MAVTTIKSYNSDNQAEVTADHELKVTGTISATNPSVGTNGAPAPASSTEVGGVDPNGDLQGLLVDSNGALIVNTSGSFGVQDLRVVFMEVAAIAVGIETTINTYTAPIGKISYLLSILNSGGNRAQYNVYDNGVLLDKQYAPVTNLSAAFDYKTGAGSVPGYVIPVGNVLTSKVVNSGTGAADYNSRFLILEVT